MAMIFLLGALLSALLSFHGVLGISGCKLPAEGLQAFCLSTKDRWVLVLQGVLGQVSLSLLPGGLLNCQIAIIPFESVRVTLVPGFGLHVLVCLQIRIRCVPVLLVEVNVTVKLCGTLKLRVGPYRLIVDGCSVAYGEITVAALLSLQLLLLVNALDGLLRHLFCRRAQETCVELSYLLDFDDGPYPFPPPGCQCTYSKYSPLVTAATTEFRFNPALHCEASMLPFPTDPGYILPLAGILYKPLFLIYFTRPHLDFLVGSMQEKQVFDIDDNLGSTVTTTSVMEPIPAMICPRGLAIVIKIMCVMIYIELHAHNALLCFTFHVAVGYSGPSGLVRLLTLTLGVDMDSLFGPKSRCADLLNVKLGVGFPRMLPSNYACDFFVTAPSVSRTLFIGPVCCVSSSNRTSHKKTPQRKPRCSPPPARHFLEGKEKAGSHSFLHVLFSVVASSKYKGDFTA